jgi:hypothetical protein
MTPPATDAAATPASGTTATAVATHEASGTTATAVADYEAPSPARERGELIELTRRIEPRAIVDLRTLGHHNAATLLGRLAELIQE